MSVDRMEHFKIAQTQKRIYVKHTLDGTQSLVEGLLDGKGRLQIQRIFPSGTYWIDSLDRSGPLVYSEYPDPLIAMGSLKTVFPGRTHSCVTIINP